VLAEKISIVPRSVDNLFFEKPASQEKINKIRKKFAIKNNQFVILSVANLDPVKGIEDVLHALYRLEKAYLNKIKYLIVGNGPAAPILKLLVKKYNLNKIVFFVGDVLHSEIIPFYDVSNLFILPSRKGALESFGRVFVEAATRSLACIGVKDGGMIDIIEEGKTGFLVSAGDIEAIKDKIIFLLKNCDITKKIGYNARIKAEKLYNRYTVSIQIEKHLKDAVENYKANLFN
jgi:glycosyltransferase involved in cell wall biosynthesis